MDNESIVVARILNPNTGAPSKTTASEVATIEFVRGLCDLAWSGYTLIFALLQARSILEILVPQVLSWSADPNNSIEAEYILMEEATGSRLDKV